MAYFDWSERLSVGVDKMDKQHQNLIKIFNELYEHLNNFSETNRSQTIKGLTDLLEYTKFHFQEEERLMEKSEYPEVKRHKLIHEDLLNQLAQHFEQIKSNSDPKAARALMAFLKTWLQGHITVIDKKYSAAVQKKAA